MYTKRGFTLIEVIVVIAIVAVIMAISFLYVEQSRNKGADGGIISNMVNARVQAEVYFTNNNTYIGVCERDHIEKIGKHVVAAAKAYGKTPEASYGDEASAWNREACHDTDDRYVVWVPLRGSKSDSPLGLCIDNLNANFREVNSVLPAGAYSCP